MTLLFLRNQYKISTTIPENIIYFTDLENTSAGSNGHVSSSVPSKSSDSSLEEMTDSLKV